MIPSIVAGPVDSGDAVRGEAFVRTLASLCGATGGLLVLEDLHWADPDTLTVVEHLTDHLDRAPVFCVVTVPRAQTAMGSIWRLSTGVAVASCCTCLD